MADQFDDIRSYRDHEAREISTRLFAHPRVSELINYLIPELTQESLEKIISDINSLWDFQHNLILPIFEKNVRITFNGLTVSGLDKLDKDKAYLFISNHRDIILDSAVLNYFLHTSGFSTAEIAIGDNLLKEDWIKDLVRLNKSFIVKRGLDKMEMLRSSKIMSDYIKDTIMNRKESIWIAQRAGRAKDGNDETNRGLLTMMGLSCEENILEHFSKLNIVPISVSYEFDPCDDRKTKEIYSEQTNGNYIKGENEDVESMKLGIILPKGNGHIHFGKPLNEEILKLDSEEKKSVILSSIRDLIDDEIHSNYKLWPTNYLANEFLNGPQVKSSFTENEKKYFNQRIENILKDLDGDKKILKEILLGMYQQPLLNFYKEK